MLTSQICIRYRQKDENASGITNSGKRNIIAVRCSIRMEVPVADNGKLLVSDEYLGYLVEQANMKFDANKTRIDRFTESFVREVRALE